MLDVSRTIMTGLCVSRPTSTCSPLSGPVLQMPRSGSRSLRRKVGPRAADATAAMGRRIEGPEWIGEVLPPDDPLLLEAEPWCDQATMTFYPEIFELDGYATRITNLLLPLNFVRSWVARGVAAETTEAAMTDFRRAIRLGRLLRQEDVVVISDLVGLACIHLATRGVYERALADGDLELALLASVVLGEVAPQRLGTKTTSHLDRSSWT